ncbi:hypothetical protein [Vagococcus acidifermentans]|uniref:Uncharacterized protein n=1 Tax=Vagococcus acidifermentans TaxID=564710 RepID=A0A430APA6_9ENTE|nr:hypothetical protein [Vagococcus acidifermentans]RSU09951.1 hypothetical protein CBF27_11685 [Vagococcus acidifermentans]
MKHKQFRKWLSLLAIFFVVGGNVFSTTQVMAEEISTHQKQVAEKAGAEETDQQAPAATSESSEQPKVEVEAPTQVEKQETNQANAPPATTQEQQAE